jgi:hypothetical protein
MSIDLAGNPQSRQVVTEAKDTSTAVTARTIAAYNTTTGLVEAATSATVVRSVAGVFTKSITALEALASAEVEKVIKDAEYIVATTNNSNVAHNGQLMVLTNAGEVNNTGTTAGAGIVKQVATVGAASAKLIKVVFV